MLIEYNILIGGVIINKIAYCGLLCEECEIYQATIKNDDAMREEVAKKFSSEDYPLTKDDINCFGCSGNEGEVFKFCNECEIRLCGIKRSLKNCGQCEDYFCEKLAKPFEMNPKNKERLDSIRNK